MVEKRNCSFCGEEIPGKENAENGKPATKKKAAGGPEPEAPEGQGDAE